MTDLPVLIKNITERRDEKSIDAFFEIVREHLFKFYCEKGIKKLLAEKVTFFAIEWILSEWQESDKKNETADFDFLFHSVREQSYNLVQFKTFISFIERRQPNYFFISPKQLWEPSRQIKFTPDEFWTLIEKATDINIFSDLINKTLSILELMDKKLEAI